MIAHSKVSFDKVKSALCAGAIAIGMCISGPAQAQVRYSAIPRGNSAKVDGTSSTHEWEMESTIVGGYLELPAGVDFDSATGSIKGAAGDKVAATAKALIPVMQLHSKAEHAPEIMDRLMQENFKAEQFCRIE